MLGVVYPYKCDHVLTHAVNLVKISNLGHNFAHQAHEISCLDEFDKFYLIVKYEFEKQNQKHIQNSNIGKLFSIYRCLDCLYLLFSIFLIFLEELDIDNAASSTL